MGKEFIEFKGRTRLYPMPYNYSINDFCLCLTEYAKDYIKNNNEKIASIDTNLRDTVLVDAINCIGEAGNMFFVSTPRCLYQKSKKYKHYFEPRWLVTTVFNNFSNYAFNGEMYNLLTKTDIGKNKEDFGVSDGANVIVDFLNYITKRNNFDRTFTIQDLHDKYVKQQHEKDLKDLRKFLELSGNYMQMLQNGKTVDNIVNDILRKNEIYEFKLLRKTGLKEVPSWQKRDIDKDLYALTYAYAKLDDDKLETDNEIIKDKIKEMSIR